MQRKYYNIFLLSVLLLFVGCTRMKPDDFSGTCSYQIDKYCNETIRIKGGVVDSAWGVSSIKKIRYTNHTDIEVWLRLGADNAIDTTVSINKDCRITFAGKEIWASEPYRIAFMNGDYYKYFELCLDNIPLPERLSKIPPPEMRRLVLREKSMAEVEIEKINLLLELQYDCNPLWVVNPALALKIFNGKKLNKLSRKERLYLLKGAIRSGTLDIIKQLLDTGINPAHGFFKRRCSLGRTQKKIYWQKGQKRKEYLPIGCMSGIAHTHGLVREAILAKNLAAAELLIKNGAPYLDEDRVILERMRTEPLKNLPPINTLARLEALRLAGVKIDDPRMGLNGINKPPLQTLPELLGFTWQCTTGTLIQAKYLLDHGAQVGLKRLFYWGCEKGNADVIFLTINGLCEKFPEKAAFWEAEVIKNILPRFVRRMVLQKRNLNQIKFGNYGASTILAEAAKYNCFEAVKLLVENNADVNLKGKGEGVTPLYCALRNGNVEIVKYLLSHGAEINSPEDIYVAGFSGNLELVKYLLKSGVDINAKLKNSSTILLSASHSGNLQLVRFLIEDQKFSISECSSKVYRTPLYAATSQNGNVELFNYLLNKGAVFNPKSKDALILMDSAAQWGKHRIIARLAELGVNINSVSLGNTPLHWAAANAHEKAVITLLSLGADSNIKNHMGLTVPEFAVKFKDTDKITQIILKQQ